MKQTAYLFVVVMLVSGCLTFYQNLSTKETQLCDLSDSGFLQLYITDFLTKQPIKIEKFIINNTEHTFPIPPEFETDVLNKFAGISYSAPTKLKIILDGTRYLLPSQFVGENITIIPQKPYPMTNWVFKCQMTSFITMSQPTVSRIEVLNEIVWKDREIIFPVIKANEYLNTSSFIVGSSEIIYCSDDVPKDYVGWAKCNYSRSIVNQTHDRIKWKEPTYITKTYNITYYYDYTEVRRELIE